MPLSKEQKDLRRRWVEALRSGKYEQGKTWLHKGDRFCCLGVACDVMAQPWEPLNLPAVEQIYDLTNFPGDPGALPSELRHRLGITLGDHNELTRLNDSGIPFCDIATLIENLPGPDE